MANIVQLRALTYVNVMDYGAIGNGSTDDTTAIQACINAASTGSTVFFPSGTYLISSPLALKPNMTYMGALNGSPGAYIKQKNGANMSVMLASSGYLANASPSYVDGPINIFSLFLDGNQSNNTGTCHGIALMTYRSRVRDVQVYNVSGAGYLFCDHTANGTTIQNSAVENRLEDSLADSCGGYGIWVNDTTGKVTDGRIINCEVRNATNTAVQVDRGAGWFILNNHVYGCLQSGYVISNAWSTFVIGNEVDGFGLSSTPGYYQGISMTLIGPRGSVCIGNVISTPESNVGSHFQYLVITGGGITSTRCVVENNVINGGYISTFLAGAVSATGSQTVAIKDITNIAVGTAITLYDTNETVTITAFNQATSTITAVFAHTHVNNAYVSSAQASSTSLGLVLSMNGTQQGAAQSPPCYLLVGNNRVEYVGTDHYNDAYVTFVATHQYGGAQLDGAVTLGNTLTLAVSSSAASLSNGSTISTSGISVARVTAASAVTGVVLQAGVTSGQVVWVLNEGTTSVTCAASGSNVSGGSSVVLAGGAKLQLIWDGSTNLWY